jgi:APA family basic amino acid/polyamine antiporter
VFVVLILGGFWAIFRQGATDTSDALRPFFTGGLSGLFQAMGYSFIALQGFDLIAAVGGEVRNPTKFIPRAMILSLGIALLIYIPLLLVIATVGTAEGQTISMLAAQDTEGIVAVAANNFLGPTGYWLVILAAVLSMYTALQANLFASSRIALAMSRDHTLPASLSQLSENRRTPNHAILVTAALVLLLLVLLPDVAKAGAAASLIFLITFAIAHWLSVLIRQRSANNPPPFRSPFYPFVPVVGGVACLALALFQGIAVPEAGTIAVIWLSIGGVLFLTLFARRARLSDISNVAANPELVRLRGNSPLVLVPIANPQNAHAMIMLAETMVPAEVGRVLLQTIVVAPEDWDPDEDPAPVDRSQAVVREVLKASNTLGVRVETLTTIARSPMEEIARVAQLHRCQSVVLGLTEISEDSEQSELEGLLGRLDTEVMVLRAPEKWQLSDIQNILVPVGGQGGHDYLLARLLGSLSRKKQRQVTFLRVVSSGISPAGLSSVRKSLDRMAQENGGSDCERVVLQSDDAVAAIAEQAEKCDLMILGIQRIGPRQKFFGSFIVQLADRTSCPIIAMSRRG